MLSTHIMDKAKIQTEQFLHLLRPNNKVKQVPNWESPKYLTKGTYAAPSHHAHSVGKFEVTFYFRALFYQDKTRKMVFTTINQGEIP